MKARYSRAMASPDTRPRSAPTYHHGDLRAALLRSAVELVAEGDLQRLSLREVARRAGVSHAAPYHHFEGKNDLLAAVAAQAFEELVARLRAAVRRRRSPRTRLEAGAHAYLDFARENPSYFRVMSMPELAYVETADGRAKLEAAQAAFSLLVELVAGACPAPLREADLRGLAVTVYATLHGFARLCIDGGLAGGQAERRSLQRALVANTAAMVAGTGKDSPR